MMHLNLENPNSSKKFERKFACLNRQTRPLSAYTFMKKFRLCSQLFFLFLILNSYSLWAQVINGPWIDTLWKKTIYGPNWPNEFIRLNLDGLQGPSPWGQNAWASINYATGGDTVYRISNPRFFNQSIKNNRWLVLPSISLQNQSYEFVWKSAATSATLSANGGYKIFICENCPNISSGNVEAVFNLKVYELLNEEGRYSADIDFQNRSISLNSFRGKSIRIAIQNTDSLKTSVGFKEFLIRSSPLRDLAVNNILLPPYSCNLKANEKVRVAIQNRGGLAAQGFTLSLFSNGTLVETKNYSGTLAFDAPDTLEFANVNMATPGNYHFKAVLSYALDSVAVNDTLSRFFFHHAPANLAQNGWKEDFSSLNMSLSKIVDKNNDGKSWGWFPPQPSPFPFEDENKFREHLRYPKNTFWPESGGNDWFIGGCVSMEKDSVYLLNVKWSSANYGNQRRIFAWIGREPLVDSLNVQLMNVVSGSGVLSDEKAGFTAPRSGVYFIGIQSLDPCYQAQTTVLKSIRINQKRNQDLALLSIFQPGDSVFTCPGQGQPVTVKVRNDGKSAFGFPSFRVEVLGPTGNLQSFNYQYPDVLPVGALLNLSIPANIDFSATGKYEISVVNWSLQDEEGVNDTAKTVFFTFPPKPATFVESFSGGGLNGLPKTWWEKPGTCYVLGNTVTRQFAGSGGIKQDLEAVSPPFTGLGSASNFVCDVLFEGASGTNNFLADGDTLEFLVSVNCGPFVSLRRFLPGRQLPTGWQPVYVDLDTLNINPSDRVYLKIRATHTANFVGLDYRVSYRLIRIEQVAGFDAQVRNPVWYPYSRVPFRHKVSFTPGFRSANGGMNALNPLTNRCTISPGGYSQVLNTNIGLNVAAFQNLSFPTFNPGQADTFRLRYQTETVNFQPDGIPENNSAETEFIVGDSVFARDYGPSTRRLGFTGTGTRGMMGQVFTLQQPDTLTGLSVFFDTLTTLVRVRPVIYLCNPNTGIPGNFPLDTNWALSNIPVSASQSWQFINLRRPADQNRGLALPAGRFFVGLIQKQGFMAMGYNKNTAERGSIYRRASAASGNAWSLIDTLGQVLVRPHFGKRLLTSNLTWKVGKPDFKIFPNPVQDQLFIERQEGKAQKVMVLNALGQMVMEVDVAEKVQAISVQKLKPGFYRIQIGGNGLGFVKE